jgi:hypothetical protein
VRRLLIGLAVVVVAAAGCFALISVLASKDSGEVGGAPGPGTFEATSNASPPSSGGHTPSPVGRDRAELTDDQLLSALQLGNVVLVYPDAKPPAELVAIQNDVSGPFDPALEQAGQAVILMRRPDAKLQALAWKRRLVASAPSDPALRDFADAWLGQGAG